MIAAILAFGLVGLGLRALPVMAGEGLLSAELNGPANVVASPMDAAAVRPAAPSDGSSSSTPSTAERKAAPKKATARAVIVPATGPRSYDVAGTGIAPATTKGRLIRYDVRVEKNLDIDPEEAAVLIEEVLNDERSWRGTGRWRFQLVKGGQSATLHAYIATPGTTDKLCAPLLTRGEVSCQNGDRVVLNAKRWLLGAEAYGADVTNYRRYLINHEFGHSLGYQHLQCPGPGKPAPVMMQQTKGLGSCTKNPWPR